VPASAKYLEAALAKAPQKPEVLDDLARTLAANGDTAGAEHVLRQRIDLDPVNETAGFRQSGILGANFLKYFRVTFDFRRGIIRLEPLPRNEGLKPEQM